MKFLISFLCTVVTFQSLYALDIVKINKAHSQQDIRYQYPLQLLVKALDATKEEFGEYKIEFSPILLKRDRALKELSVGKLINIHSTPTRKEWEDKIQPIYFPIRKGILGYREFLINKEDIQKFKNLQSIDELKKLNAGLGLQWSTTKAMKKLDFSVVTGESYEGLFAMLEKKRFDYFPRGINEIYSEYSARKKEYPNMVIEKSKILYLPLPTYFFVSPKNKRLHERVKKGLQKIYLNGKFDALFNEYHKEYLTKANMKSRTIFYLKNPLINYHEVFNNPKLWINSND